MNNETLYALKAQYEQELIRAEAKVAVITDIINSIVPTPVEPVEVDCTTDCPDEISQNSIY